MAVGGAAGSHVQHGVVGCAAFGGIGGCDRVDYILGFLLADFYCFRTILALGIFPAGCQGNRRWEGGVERQESRSRTYVRNRL